MRFKSPKRKRVNFKDVDVERVLHHLGVEFTRREDELYARCFHPKHKDTKPSWHIKAERGHSMNGVFNCWACHWRGNLLTLITERLKVDAAQAFDLMEKYSTAAPDLTNKDVGESEYLGSSTTQEPPEISLAWKGEPIEAVDIEEGSPCFEYLMSRQIGELYMHEFGLKDWRDQQRVVVPITRRGRLISWVARSYSRQHPKTLAPAGAPKRWELFGLDLMERERKEVSIAEGWVDAIRLMQAGQPNPVAICGSKMSEHQAEEFLFAERITLWLDGDKAGEVMGEDVVSWLGRGREILVVPTPPGKDPGDFRPQELAAMQPNTWSNYQRRKRR